MGPSQSLQDTRPSPLQSAEAGSQGHLAQRPLPLPPPLAPPNSTTQQPQGLLAGPGLPQRRILHFLQSSTQVLYNPDTRKSFPESNLYPPSAAHVSGPGLRGLPL